MLGQIKKSERSAAAVEPRREKMRRARDMYRAGWKLVKIAAEIAVPPGTVRRWKCVYHWADGAEKAGQKNESACNAPLCGELPDVLTALDAPALTGKQSLFVILYAKTCNATRSYWEVYGCSYASALVRGPVLAGKPEIQSAVRRVRKSMLSQMGLDPDDIFQKFIEIAFADITDFVEFEGEAVRLRPLSEIDGTLLQELSCDGVKIKLPDRLKALRWLGDRMGLLTEMQRARVDKLRAQTERIQQHGGSGAALEDDPITNAIKESFGLLCVQKEAVQRPGEAVPGGVPAVLPTVPTDGVQDAASGPEHGNGPGRWSRWPGQPRENPGGISSESVFGRKGYGNDKSEKRKSRESTSSVSKRLEADRHCPGAEYSVWDHLPLEKCLRMERGPGD